MPEPHHIAFRRAVLGVNGGPGDEAIVRLACELARPNRAEVVAVHIVEIDWTLPLDADVASRSDLAQQVLDTAEATAERCRYQVEPVLLQARDVGAALVDEAIEREADLLVLSLPYRKRFGGDFALGSTIPYVFKNSPCEVWVVREPMPEETA